MRNAKHSQSTQYTIVHVVRYQRMFARENTIDDYWLRRDFAQYCDRTSMFVTDDIFVFVSSLFRDLVGALTWERNNASEPNLERDLGMSMAGSLLFLSEIGQRSRLNVTKKSNIIYIAITSVLGRLERRKFSILLSNKLGKFIRKVLCQRDSEIWKFILFFSKSLILMRLQPNLVLHRIMGPICYSKFGKDILRNEKVMTHKLSKVWPSSL